MPLEQSPRYWADEEVTHRGDKSKSLIVGLPRTPKSSLQVR